MGDVHMVLAGPLEPLPPDFVRWFSYKAALGEEGKITEVPHRGSLLRFCAADSAALENAYRQRREELERCWWEEEAALLSKDSKGSSASLSAEASGGAADGGGEGAAGEAAGRAAGNARDWAYFTGGCTDAQGAGVLVRSGAFEVDLAARQLRPCYWPAARHRVLRGTWFAEKGGEWVPLKESLAEQLEEGYRQAIWLPARGRLAEQPGGGAAARLELSSHVDKGLYALFASESEAWLCQDTSWGWLRRIGAAPTAGQQRLRLRRGYEPPATKALLDKEADVAQEELDDACAGVPVSRLVLVVHGIGQKLEAANIAQVAQDQSAAGLLDEQAAGGRTEVLPVQWRKNLYIEADALSRQLMPPGIPSLRQVLHSTVVEILLFMTPQHRAEIVASLVASLNAAHARFMLRNPGFQGSVSILAHSLGTVLCYDVLCNQPPPAQLPGLRASPPLQQREQAAAAQWPQAATPRRSAAGDEEMAIDLTPDTPTAALQQELARLRSKNHRLQLQLEAAQMPGSDGAGSAGAGSRPQPPVLHFSVDQLILLGSPLGCFLALRGVSVASGVALGSGASAPLMRLAPGLPVMPDGLPLVTRLLNVYHPYDPVAHRLEPLALLPGEVQRAAFVPLFKGGKRIHLAMQEFSEDVGSAASRIGSSLLSSLAFSSFKRSATFKKEVEGDKAAAAAEASAAAEAAAEEEAARQMGRGRPQSAPSLADRAAAEAEALGGEGGLLFASTSHRALAAASPKAASPIAAPARGASPAQLLRQSSGGSGAAAAGEGSRHGSSGLARVADGVPAPGSRTARGRVDFVMQESSLENQYLSALSAHFAYWASPDVALLVLRAVHGLDVLTGAGAGAAQAAAAAQGAPTSPEAAAARGGQPVEAGSPPMHLVASP